MFSPDKSKGKIALVVYLFLAVLLVCTGPLPSATAAPAGGSPAEEAAMQEEKAAFIDLAADSALYPYVRYLAGKGIIKGFPDGTFRPAENVTRAQAARVVVQAIGLQPLKDGPPTFSDVPAGHWAYGEIEAATKAGLFKGYPDGTFRPDSVITRAEAVTLLLNLSGGALSGKAGDIADVGPDHWAYRQVSTAVEAGLVELSAGKLFGPDLAFRRGDLARSLSAMFTLGPALRTTGMTGKLAVKKGRVTVTAGDGIPRAISGGTTVGAGTKVATDDGSRAEITFDDGSGILLEAGTELSITRARGFTYMRRDGSPGVAVDRLEIKLERGKIFGALASRYEFGEQAAGGKRTAFRDGVEENSILLASLELPPGQAGALLAQNEAGEAGAVPWWAEPYTERERVVVDMPWGVAGIRGTFWMNEVSASGQSTALITGHATVTANGQTVSVAAGQSTVITSPTAPPAPPAALTQAEKQAWLAVKDWVTERASVIQNNVPAPPPPAVLPPEVPVEQPPVPAVQQQQAAEETGIADVIKQSLEDATGSKDTISNSGSSGSSGGGSSVPGMPGIETVTFVGDTVTLTLSETVVSGIIVESSEEPWHPEIVLAGGRTYKIGIWDNNGNWPLSLEGIQVSGKTIAITAIGAQDGEQYTARLYTGTCGQPDFAVVAVSGSFTFSAGGISQDSQHYLGIFTTVNNAVYEHKHFTSTLLNNGKVLIAGGWDKYLNTQANAELFDPAANSFSTVGSMVYDRGHHTATLLPNGKVLIAGGYSDYYQEKLNSAELFDPVTNGFSTVSSMVYARSGHAATLLNNGKVLITGGYDNNYNLVAAAELFDPDTNSFSIAGSMVYAREGHTATLLDNGKVLITGGYNWDFGERLTIAEIFDPATNSFSTVSSMVYARSGHTATLLNNGKVLIAGGYDNDYNLVAAAELFDPDTNSFSTAGSMMNARGGHTATLLNNGKVLIAGGAGDNYNILKSAELFDPSTSSFTLTGDMNTVREGHTATKLKNGKVLVVGGYNSDNGFTVLKSAELYQ